MKNINNRNRVIIGGFTVALLSACSSSDDTATLNNTFDPVSVDTVEVALVELPNGILPRFALSNSEVTAFEVFRRIDILNNGTQVVSWGVEGATEDELLELEARYDGNEVLIENIRNELLDSLLASIETDLFARYPDAIIDEIARSTSDEGVTYAILLETMGEEIEVNYDANAILLFVEDVEEREGIPATILAIVDALEVTLPDSEFEIITFADGSIEYAVEYENDVGQSISVSMNAVGDIFRIEHEDALGNLSQSDTVVTALEEFPDNIEEDFALMFTEVTAAEIFRNLNFSDSASVVTRYGIEGVSDDEALEVEAIFSAEGVLIEQTRGEIIDTLPAVVDVAFSARFPGVSIDELIEVFDTNGVRYEIVFEQNGEELEANYNSEGVFIALEDALEEEDIPAVILEVLGAERVLLPILEVEAVTTANGSISYAAEYENEEGESISYGLNADGSIVSIEHEGAL